jgi:hypothetical protein
VNKAAPILALVVLRMAVVGQTPDRSLLVPIVPQFLAIPSSSRTHAPNSSERDSASNPCTFHGLFQHAKIEAEEFGRGVASAPWNAVRPANLKWELPIAATTGILIAEGDQPLARRIQGKSIEDVSRLWSNFGLSVEIASGGLAYVGGCARHRVYLRDTGLTILDALAAAGTADLVLKLAFDRQFPYTHGSTGKFWGGGRSFPSRHAASSFAFATAIANRYPDKPWLKLAAYGLATGVALSRYPAKRHYASDILVGAILEYVTGDYMAQH